ncbi:MAG: flagellar biosynthesis anti-sigma factor FlgM [Oligoflexia bacterium]|nr:flagellar biosynthesis anti-sigma factor FlgM [Oligoflexia bacterium]
MDEIKIRKSVTDLAQSDSLAVQQQAGRKTKKVSAEQIAQAVSAGEDTVDVGVAKYIQAALDPEKLAAERKEKLERLKKAVQSGEYNPPAEAVAMAVGQDIVMEIFDAQNLNLGEE